ncbi:hypothetical protein [Streptomyces sp. NPDC051546]|uniref:LppU/SCO3897 family protein n=1 Tax=Streptomyces sp. NPDC051546 TaxID=3365655 RepID=UPI0037A180B5
MATPPPPQAGPYGPYAARQPQQPGPTGPYAPPQSAGPYGPQAAYGPQAPHAAQVPPQPGPYGSWSAPRPSYGCRLCGAGPAAEATVRGHQGMVVLMRFLSLRGPFCRDCGLATYRRMSADTLWQGWWGPLSLFATPVTLLLNLGPRAAFRRLAPPTGGHRPPLDPGRPLRRRPAALLFLVPALFLLLAVPTLILIGVLAGDDTPHPLVSGQCVRNEGDWSHQNLRVTDCAAPDAQYRATRPSQAPGGTCAPGDFLALPAYSPEGTVLYCLTPLR